MTETFDWVKPSLLWQADAQDFRRADFFQPRLLEFRSDNFMDDFLAAAGAAEAGALQSFMLTRPAGSAVKLFQPIHGRYYLLCGSLCCHLPGFPDRVVRRADGESVFYVLRKLAGGVEYGWTVKEEQKGWRPAGANSLLPDEERLPLFPATTKNGRTLLFGYVPVASRDTYAAAPADSLVDFTSDLRLEELQARFLGPVADLQTLPPDGIALRLSVYLLLDLWDYLNEHLPDVAAALRDDTTGSLSGNKLALVTYLEMQVLAGSVKLKTALRDVARSHEALDSLAEAALPAPFNSDYQLRGKSFPALTNKVKDALGNQPQPRVEVPKFAPLAGERFILRCVYERARCDPPHLYVSRPSPEFQLAPFYDPDAPARKLRIGLPTDVSIGGLRKFQKGVSFMMSNALRNKLKGIHKGMLKGDDPGGDGAFDLGHICSFSIPIITLCAFILLLIIVVLLNIVFFWLPFFKICFPLKLKSR